MTTTVEELCPGSRLGPYIVEARLAEGGMATLWRARIDGEAHPVVLKTMLPHLARHPEIAAMFAREASLSARLAHPNIVPVHDLGILRGRPFIEMPLVEGPNLRQLLRAHLRARRPFPAKLALAACADASDALAYLHDFSSEDGEPEGLVHRDVSPENLLLGVDGRTRLLDFGVATSEVATWTRVGQLKGKLHYMAPETFKGVSSGAGRDVFALGVSLYELVAGRRPFRAKTEAELMYAISEGQYPRLSDLRRDIPGALVELVHRALSPKPEARGSALRFGDDARAVLAELGVDDPRGEAADLLATCDLAEGLTRAVDAGGEPSLPGETRSMPAAAESEDDIFTAHRRRASSAGGSPSALFAARRDPAAAPPAAAPRAARPMSLEASRHFERGLEYKRRGLLRETLGEWEMAAQLDPDSRLIRTNLRRIREKLRR
jgi:serine/threonine-protein kinase